MSKVGVVSGKFRILHQGHKELMIRSVGICDEVHIIITDNPSLKRYSSINELKQAIGAIYNGVGFKNFKIHVVSEMEQGPEWDKKVLELVPNVDVMFNSKENYDNELIKNKYINCYTSLNLSASEIEKDLINNFHNIAAEFRLFLNKKIVITGIESCGKTTIAKKLASFLNTVYSEECGRYYSDLFLGGQDDTYSPKDFVHIVMEQTLQDKRKNLLANNYLIVDTDPIVTLYYLDLYKDDKMDCSMEQYQTAFNMIEQLIKNYREKVDLVLYLEPDVPFVEDGKRWVSDLERRKKLNEKLKNMYRKYGIDFKIISSTEYDERFNECLLEIKKL